MTGKRGYGKQSAINYLSKLGLSSNFILTGNLLRYHSFNNAPTFNTIEMIKLKNLKLEMENQI